MPPVTQCPHPGLHVGGLDYWCIKQKALNGGRSKLTDEQLGFVGVPARAADRPPTGWTQPRSPRLDQQLDELDKLRDVMPGWFALTRRILEPE